MASNYWWILLIYAFLCCLFVVRFNFHESWMVRALFKTLPMGVISLWAALVAVQGSGGGVGSGMGIRGTLFWGLLCSGLGDLWLAVPKAAPAGVLAFTAAQVLYVVLFIRMQHDGVGFANWIGPACGMLAVETAIFAWLFKVAGTIERVAPYRLLLLFVYIYLCTLAMMTGVAIGLFGSRPTWSTSSAVLGALLFWISDHIIVSGAYYMLTREQQEIDNAAAANRDGENKAEGQAVPVAPGGKEAPPPTFRRPADARAAAARWAIMITYYTAQLFIGLSVPWH